MRAIAYRVSGDPDVLSLEERPAREPGPGEVRVRVRVSGINPTDWKARRGSAPGRPVPYDSVVPHQDGAGDVDAVGEGVADLEVGQRVWIWEAAWKRADGTAQEQLVIPRRNVVPLGDGVSYDVGASLGIPALTAHRALTVFEGAPDRLAPGALDGVVVLVAGGAGAVGHAAIQLARWAGATVVTTVSGPAKAALATSAGAHHVVDYRADDAAERIRSAAPDGVHVVVEVAPGANAALDRAVLAPGGTIAVYATERDGGLDLPVLPLMQGNVRYQFVLVYTTDEAAKQHAVAAVAAAAGAGALEVGEDHGLPLLRYPLERTAAAQAAVEGGATGKVVVDVSAGTA